MFNLDRLIQSEGGQEHRDLWTPANGNAPTLGQTSFTLSAVPFDPLLVTVILNGVEYLAGAAAGGYFTVSGSTLTWNGPPSLTTTDEFIVLY